VAWTNLVRSVWMVAEVEDKEDSGKRMLVPAKANLAAEQKGVLYKLSPLDVREQEEAIEGYAGALSKEDKALIKEQLFRVRWVGTTNATADKVFAGQKKERQNNVDQCVRWLKEFLAKFAYPDAEVKAAAEAKGFSDRTLRSAKEALRKDTPSLEFSNRGAFQGAWWNGLGSPENWIKRPEPTGDSDKTVKSVKTGESGKSGCTRTESQTVLDQTDSPDSPDLTILSEDARTPFDPEPERQPGEDDDNPWA